MGQTTSFDDGKILVVQDFLSEQYLKKIIEILEDNDFPWFFQPNTVTGAQYPDSNPFYGFRHLFVVKDEMNSLFGSYLMPLAWQMSDLVKHTSVSVLNMYANMVLQKQRTISDEDWYRATAHNDGSLNLESAKALRYTGLLYLDDSDGDTVFFDEINDRKIKIAHRQTPVKNTLVLFRSSKKHSPGLPYTSFMRRVLNINLLVYS